jgi:NAD(P)-dependent dehydrogenase (short-subunit alcohol dehydrogenase family)
MPLPDTDGSNDMAQGALAGRVALVTGGLRGISLACARRFVTNGAGVVIGSGGLHQQE